MNKHWPFIAAIIWLLTIIAVMHFDEVRSKNQIITGENGNYQTYDSGSNKFPSKKDNIHTGEIIPGPRAYYDFCKRYANTVDACSN